LFWAIFTPLKLIFLKFRRNEVKTKFIPQCVLSLMHVVGGKPKLFKLIIP